MKHSNKLGLVVVLITSLLMMVLPSNVAAQDVLDANEALVMGWIQTTYTPDPGPLSYLPGSRWTSVDERFASNFVFFDDSDAPAVDFDQFLDEVKGPIESLNLEGVYVKECALRAEHDLVEACFTVEGAIPETILRLPFYYRVLFRIEDGRIAEAWLNHGL